MKIILYLVSLIGYLSCAPSSPIWYRKIGEHENEIHTKKFYRSPLGDYLKSQRSLVAYNETHRYLEKQVINPDLERNNPSVKINKPRRTNINREEKHIRVIAKNFEATNIPQLDNTYQSKFEQTTANSKISNNDLDFNMVPDTNFDGIRIVDLKNRTSNGKKSYFINKSEEINDIKNNNYSLKVKHKIEHADERKIKGEHFIDTTEISGTEPSHNIKMTTTFDTIIPNKYHFTAPNIQEQTTSGIAKLIPNESEINDEKENIIKNDGKIESIEREHFMGRTEADITKSSLTKIKMVTSNGYEFTKPTIQEYNSVFVNDEKNVTSLENSSKYIKNQNRSGSNTDLAFEENLNDVPKKSIDLEIHENISKFIECFGNCSDSFNIPDKIKSVKFDSTIHTILESTPNEYDFTTSNKLEGNNIVLPQDKMEFIVFENTTHFIQPPEKNKNTTKTEIENQETFLNETETTFDTSYFDKSTSEKYEASTPNIQEPSTSAFIDEEKDMTILEPTVKNSILQETKNKEDRSDINKNLKNSEDLEINENSSDHSKCSVNCVNTSDKSKKTESAKLSSTDLTTPNGPEENFSVQDEKYNDDYSIDYSTEKIIRTEFENEIEDKGIIESINGEKFIGTTDMGIPEPSSKIKMVTIFDTSYFDKNTSDKYETTTPNIKESSTSDFLDKEKDSTILETTTNIIVLEETENKVNRSHPEKNLKSSEDLEIYQNSSDHSECSANCVNTSDIPDKIESAKFGSTIPTDLEGSTTNEYDLTTGPEQNSLFLSESELGNLGSEINNTYLLQLHETKKYTFKHETEKTFMDLVSSTSSQLIIEDDKYDNDYNTVYSTEKLIATESENIIEDSNKEKDEIIKGENFIATTEIGFSEPSSKMKMVTTFETSPFDTRTNDENNSTTPNIRESSTSVFVGEEDDTTILENTTKNSLLQESENKENRSHTKDSLKSIEDLKIHENSSDHSHCSGNCVNTSNTPNQTESAKFSSTMHTDLKGITTIDISTTNEYDYTTPNGPEENSLFLSQVASENKKGDKGKVETIKGENVIGVTEMGISESLFRIKMVNPTFKTSYFDKSTADEYGSTTLNTQKPSTFVFSDKEKDITIFETTTINSLLQESENEDHKSNTKENLKLNKDQDINENSSDHTECSICVNTSDPPSKIESAKFRSTIPTNLDGTTIVDFRLEENILFLPESEVKIVNSENNIDVIHMHKTNKNTSKNETDTEKTFKNLTETSTSFQIIVEDKKFGNDINNDSVGYSAEKSITTESETIKKENFISTTKMGLPEPSSKIKMVTTLDTIYLNKSTSHRYESTTPSITESSTSVVVGVEQDTTILENTAKNSLLKQSENEENRSDAKKNLKKNEVLKIHEKNFDYSECSANCVNTSDISDKIESVKFGSAMSTDLEGTTTIDVGTTNKYYFTTTNRLEENNLFFSEMKNVGSENTTDFMQQDEANQNTAKNETDNQETFINVTETSTSFQIIVEDENLDYDYSESYGLTKKPTESEINKYKNKTKTQNKEDRDDTKEHVISKESFAELSKRTKDLKFHENSSDYTFDTPDKTESVKFDSATDLEGTTIIDVGTTNEYYFTTTNRPEENNLLFSEIKNFGSENTTDFMQQDEANQNTAKNETDNQENFMDVTETSTSFQIIVEDEKLDYDYGESYGLTEKPIKSEINKYENKTQTQNKEERNNTKEHVISKESFAELPKRTKDLKFHENSSDYTFDTPGKIEYVEFNSATDLESTTTIDVSYFTAPNKPEVNNFNFSEADLEVTENSTIFQIIVEDEKNDYNYSERYGTEKTISTEDQTTNTLLPDFGVTTTEQYDFTTSNIPEETSLIFSKEKTDVSGFDFEKEVEYKGSKENKIREEESDIDSIDTGRSFQIIVVDEVETAGNELVDLQENSSLNIATTAGANKHQTSTTQYNSDRGIKLSKLMESNVEKKTTLNKIIGENYDKFSGRIGVKVVIENPIVQENGIV